MPNTNELENVVNTMKSLLEAVQKLQNSEMAGILQGLTAASNNISGSNCNESCCEENSSPTCLSKFKTLFKFDAPGFTSESLKVTLQNTGDHDRVIIDAANKYRGPIHHVVDLDFFVDRETFSTQLRYGVLKVSGKKYVNITPEIVHRLESIEVRPEMKS